MGPLRQSLDESVSKGREGQSLAQPPSRSPSSSKKSHTRAGRPEVSRIQGPTLTMTGKSACNFSNCKMRLTELGHLHRRTDSERRSSVRKKRLGSLPLRPLGTVVYAAQIPAQSPMHFFQVLNYTSRGQRVTARSSFCALRYDKVVPEGESL